MTESAGTARRRRTPSLPLAVLMTIYIVALLASAVLYVVGFVVSGNDPAGAGALFTFANGFGSLGVVGAMLHLAVGAIRHAVEDVG
ncbi:hypothetical protein [Leifsonia sp. SIMBA_070]|uniref:hypothetical protein n=1 Tax=Leifsonia sp. SIMBA_070 TaxID=3085810 RepID=UPI00397D77C5